MTRTQRRGWAGAVTAIALALWGALHLVGGLSLVAAGAAEGLQALAPQASIPAPSEPGQGVAALLHFHGLNVAAAGLAALILAVAWRVTGRHWQLGVALGLAVVFDLGLVVFLVGPGLLPVSQGLLGPGLLALALAGTALLYRRRAPLTA